MIIPLISWLSYLLPTIVLCLPIWILGRKRVKWLRWELISILVLPFLVWFILVILNLKPKSLANLGELEYLGYLTPLGAILRVVIGRRGNSELVASGVVLLYCVLALGLYWFFPVLPE